MGQSFLCQMLTPPPALYFLSSLLECYSKRKETCLARAVIREKHESLLPSEKQRKSGECKTLKINDKGFPNLIYNPKRLKADRSLQEIAGSATESSNLKLACRNHAGKFLPIGRENYRAER